MLYKLVEILNKEDKDWRKKTIVLLDNASYHKTKLVKGLIEKLQIPVLYNAPYSPQLAPIELLFAHIKKGDLNPTDMPVTKK